MSVLTQIEVDGTEYDINDAGGRTLIEGLDSGKVDKVAGKGLSTEDYTSDEKTKLGNLPTGTELATALNGKMNTSDYVNFTGATASSAGAAGRVPAPSSLGMYLDSSGVWVAPDTAPTSGSSKLITSDAVHDALDNVEVDVDDAMSNSSTNPVQNRVLYEKMTDPKESNAIYHAGFYVDVDGDVCQA